MEIKRLNAPPFATNCYLAIEGGSAVLIDAAVPAADTLRACALAGARLEGVLLTHGHFDHITFLEEYPGDVPVYIHPADAPMLSDARLNASFLAGLEFTAPRPGALPMADSGLLRLGEVCLELWRSPGHTPGSMCLRCGQDVFCGDTLFAVGRGRTDLPGGSEEALETTLAALRVRFALCTLHPGHGGQFALPEARA